MVLPLLHVSGLQKFPHQGQELLVLDSPAQDMDEDVVVKAVEARLDVALHHPAHTGEGALNLGQRRVAAPLRAEAMGAVGKSGFINCFQYHPDDFLHQLVIGRGNPQRTLFRGIVLLGDVGPAGRIRLVALVFQGCYDFVDTSCAHVVDGHSIRAFCHASR